MTTLRRIAGAVSGRIKTTATRRRTRRALMGLEDHILRDIGLDPKMMRELRRPENLPF